MGLKNIAESLDAQLRAADAHIEGRRAKIIESDERKMAHHIMAYVLERSSAGTDPFDLGAAMVQGAQIGESESGGVLTEPVLEFLEAVLEGARSALDERYGGEPLTLDPVQHAAQYYQAHGKWPESATPGVIAKAKAALNSSKIVGTYL